VEAGRVIGGEGTRYQSAMSQGSVGRVHVERATNTARDRLQQPFDRPCPDIRQQLRTRLAF
jgi:hypothetical protein